MKKLSFVLLILIYSAIGAQETPTPPATEKTAGEIKTEQETTYWDEEKTKVKIQTSFYRDGDKEIPHGPSKSYYPNGKVFIERIFDHGKIDGTETHYTDKGELDLVLEWNKGDLLREKKYKNGKPSTNTELRISIVKNPQEGKPDIKKAVKNGLQEIYYIDGGIRLRIYWKDDIKDGLETLYYKSTKKKYTLNWKDGVKEGIETQWFESGKTSSITNWADGKPQGEMINYHENGTKKDQLEFDKGVIVNDRLSWNDQGEVIGKCTYKDGAPYSGTLFDIENLLLITFENGRQVSSKICDRSGKLR